MLPSPNPLPGGQESFAKRKDRLWKGTLHSAASVQNDRKGRRSMSVILSAAKNLFPQTPAKVVMQHSPGKGERSEVNAETGSRNSLTRRLEQSLAGQTPYGPAIHRARALRAVEILRAGVPVEHRPFHSGPSALGRDLREPLEHRLADPAAPILLEYEKIFQVESRMAAPGRIGMKKKREAEGVACVLRNQTFERRVAIFHLCEQPGGSCLNRFGLTLELRKCADEAMDRFGVARRREADGGSHQGLSLNAARRLACSALNLESRPSGAVRTSQTP